MNPFVPILVMAAVAAALAIGGLAASAVIGPKRYNGIKVANYECGVEATPRATGAGRFPIKYYHETITFISFDLEVIFLVQRAIAFSYLAATGLSATLAVIAIVTVPIANG